MLDKCSVAQLIKHNIDGNHIYWNVILIGFMVD